MLRDPGVAAPRWMERREFSSSSFCYTDSIREPLGLPPPRPAESGFAASVSVVRRRAFRGKTYALTQFPGVFPRGKLSAASARKKWPENSQLCCHKRIDRNWDDSHG